MLNLLRRLTGPTDGKAATDLPTRRSRIIEMLTGNANWTTRDYKAFATEGYQNAVWVYACLQEISLAAKRINIRLYRINQAGERDEVQPGDTASDTLHLLQHPNSHATWHDLIEAIISYRALAGDYYLVGLGPGDRTVQRGTTPRRIYTLRPDRVRIKPTGRGRDYAIEHGPRDNPTTYQPGEFLHGRTFHPTNDWQGMGSIESAWRGVDLWNAAMSSNTALMQNGARPSGAWVTEERLTDEQFERMKSQARQYAGVKAAGEQLVLEGGVDWRDMQLSPRDLDWGNTLEAAAIQIHAAFKVHPVLTGMRDAKFENQDYANRMLYTRAVLPALDSVLSDLTRWLHPSDSGLAFGYDRDEIEALADDRDQLYRRTTNAFTSGLLSREEARQELGYDATPEGGSTFYGDEQVLRAGPTPTGVKGLQYSKAARAAAWKAADDQTVRNEKRMERAVKRVATAELNAVLDAVTQATIDTVHTMAAMAVTTRPWVDTLERENLATALDAGRNFRANLKLDAGPMEGKAFNNIFGGLFPQVLEWIRTQAASQVGHITATTKQSIRDALEEGITNGEAILDLRNRVEDLYLQQIVPNRSTVIARTETLRANNYASQEAARSTGIKMRKVWLATADGRVRPDHANADGQVRALDDSFDVGGEVLQYPGDPNASAWNTIQCRCAVAHEVEES